MRLVRRTSAPTMPVTSSLASAGGPKRFVSPAGRPTNPSGPAVAHASRSVQPEGGKVSTTTGTSGPSSLDSSPSAALQSALASRLRQRTGARGSLEYDLTWKEWDIGSGPPICALRARARPTSASVSTGWQTPMSQDGAKQDATLPVVLHRIVQGKQIGLAMRASLTEDPTLLGNTRKQLGDVLVSGWATPRAEDAESAGMRHSRGTADTLSAQAGQDLAGWATPTTRDAKDGACENADVPTKGVLGRQVVHLPTLGPTSFSSPAETGSRGALNPEFSRWLMGFPAEWGSCGATAMQSSRKSRPRFSKRISMSEMVVPAAVAVTL